MIKIVKFTEEYLDKIVEIENECFSIPWSKKSFEGELKNPNAYYFVAMIEDEVVGYGGMWYIINEAHITNIAVSPKHHRKNIGSEILKAILNESENLEIIGVTLEVNENNIPAIKMYEKFGFENEGLRKNYYENNENAIIMWLNF